MYAASSRPTSGIGAAGSVPSSAGSSRISCRSVAGTAPARERWVTTMRMPESSTMYWRRSSGYAGSIGR
ncbi:hypothetical protein BG846_05368 [Streptomyces fradiae ATCC 10745 = DSM 40063]|uniref:Uncharacterized protein n=1 Tax=Streptomyces fradiae ATCC 10745 = DSM 40063 TaxID=1319510 RepID=A0A1Y2NNF3_STRFR|nr:hypothetical protein BG846_05368 [Streptomyces fradiae ATCC 10745 = DSM 40063]